MVCMVWVVLSLVSGVASQRQPLLASNRLVQQNLSGESDQQDEMLRRTSSVVPPAPLASPPVLSATAAPPYSGAACVGVGNPFQDQECLYEISSSLSDMFSALGELVWKAGKNELHDVEYERVIGTLVNSALAVAPLFLSPPFGAIVAALGPFVSVLVTNLFGLESDDPSVQLQNKLEQYVDQQFISRQRNQNTMHMQLLKEEHSWTPGLFLNASQDPVLSASKLSWLLTMQHSMATDSHLFFNSDCMQGNALPRKMQQIDGSVWCSPPATPLFMGTETTTLDQCKEFCNERGTCEFFNYYPITTDGWDRNRSRRCVLFTECSHRRPSYTTPVVHQKQYRIEYKSLYAGDDTSNRFAYCDVNASHGTHWPVGDLSTRPEECAQLCSENATCKYATFYHSPDGCLGDICQIDLPAPTYAVVARGSECSNVLKHLSTADITTQECADLVMGDPECGIYFEDRAHGNANKRCSCMAPSATCQVNADANTNRYVIKTQRATKCLLSSECIASPTSYPPTTVSKKKFVTDESKTCKDWRRAGTYIGLQAYSLLHTAVFGDILGFKQELRHVVIDRMIAVDSRYLSHLRASFDEFKTHRLSLLESPKYDGGRLSRGYDKFYATADAPCGERGPYHKHCDVLVTHCGLFESERRWDHIVGIPTASRRAFYLRDDNRAQQAMQCFFEYKLRFDQTMSTGFELVWQSLNRLVKGAIRQSNSSMDLPAWLQ